MSIWSTILLLLISTIGLFIWIKQSKHFQDIIFQLNGVFIFLFLILFFTVDLSVFGNFDTDLVTRWLQVILTSLSLTLLANMLRKLKPSYAKYPLLFSFLPLLLVAVFPLIRESEVIYNLLYRLALGGGSLSFLLMSVMLWKKNTQLWSLFMGAMLLFIAYLLEWFFTDISSYHPWTVHTSISASIPLILLAFKRIEIHINH
jgi:hypothetical protein